MSLYVIYRTKSGEIVDLQHEAVSVIEVPTSEKLRVGERIKVDATSGTVQRQAFLDSTTGGHTGGGSGGSGGTGGSGSGGGPAGGGTTGGGTTGGGGGGTGGSGGGTGGSGGGRVR
ncbi:MAG TPA: hypothetical protein VMF11_08930 [Candidatus Baltobacteraceae bacterium]|nr:hypothetical protein [Candidatus Baltobacteraceae bacterium]